MTPSPPPAPAAGGSHNSWYLVVAAAGALFVAALWGALVYAPTVRIEGDIQRLFYLHVPAAMTMYAAYAVVFLGSILYLTQRRERWDTVAASAAEVGTVFGTIVLTTGPVWAKKAWGTWWVWDARLTSTLVLWLIFVAYLMLRTYGGEQERVARFAAVLGIVGFADLPIIHYSVQWWRTLHPAPKIMTEGSPGGGLEPVMLAVFGLGLAATLALFALLLQLRVRLERIARRLPAARERARSLTPPGAIS